MKPHTLRAAALLPVFSLVALHAAEPAPVTTAPAAPVQADAPAAPVATLGKTVVVASRRQEALTDVSPSVSVVSKDEIETRQLHTIAEALAYSPGVIVATSGALGGNQSVFTRGTESNHTAVLLDGRRVSPGFSGSSEIERFSLAGINSVELLRGASSTLYGANALGGVINLRTTDTLGLRKNTGELSAEIGRFGYTDFGVSAAGNTNNAGDDVLVQNLGASVAYTQTATDNKRANNDFARNNLLQKTEYRISDHVTAELLNEYYVTKAGVPGQLGPNSSTTERLDQDGWMTSPGLRFDTHDGVRGSTFYAYSFSNLETYGNASPFRTPERKQIDKQEFTSKVEFDIAAIGLATLGYTYENTAFDRENRTTGAELPGSPHWESHSPWGRLELFTKDKSVAVGAGARYQHFDEFKSAITGETFGSYHAKETGTLLTAKVSTAYAAPSALDYQYGTPTNHIKPESTFAWEVGARQQLFEKSMPTEVGVVYFENRMKDFVDFDYSTFPNVPPQNAPEARARGVEFFTEVHPAKQLKLFANATIQDARYTKDFPALTRFEGDRLLRRPAYQATLGAELTPVESVTLGTSATAVIGREDFGHVDQGDFVLVRVYGSWQFTKNAKIFARVENVTDENYDPASNGFPGLPLAAYVGMSVGF